MANTLKRRPSKARRQTPFSHRLRTIYSLVTMKKRHDRLHGNPKLVSSRDSDRSKASNHETTAGLMSSFPKGGQCQYFWSSKRAMAGGNRPRPISKQNGS